MLDGNGLINATLLDGDGSGTDLDMQAVQNWTWNESAKKLIAALEFGMNLSRL